MNGDGIAMPPSYMLEEQQILKEVKACFVPSRLVRFPPPDFLLRDIAHYIRMARAEPKDFMTGQDRTELAKAIRIILDGLPPLIERADAEAAKARAEARSTSLDVFARDARVLHSAALPFLKFTEPFNPRGGWHGWARILRVMVQHVLTRQQPRLGFLPDHPINKKRWQVSFGKATSPGIIILCKLLALAGFPDKDPEAVISALDDTPKTAKRAHPRRKGG